MSVAIKVQDPSQTAEARRAARKMAEEIGFDHVRAEQVAIAVTEACTNLLKHAGGGEILIDPVFRDQDTLSSLELLSLDRGPGMTNLEQCLRDGYSTGGSAGEGMGAIVRLSSAADFYSVPGKGTGVLARWSPPDLIHGKHGPLQIGAVNVSKPGQDVCGDAWGVEQTADTTLILVADGLGHGPEARNASAEAVRMLHTYPHLNPGALLERVHQALRSTRGAAVAVALIERAAAMVTFAGVGNISAQIYGGSKQGQHLVSGNGTAGHQMPRIHEFRYPWPDGGMIVLHSDGLTSAAGLENQPALALRDASLIAGILYRDFTRGNDDSTVVVAKAR